MQNQGTSSKKGRIGKYVKSSIVSGESFNSYIPSNLPPEPPIDLSEIYPYRIEGIGKNMIPTATDFEVIDYFEKVSDEESAHSARETSLKEGMFVGYTSGATVQAIKQLNETNFFDENSNVVCIFPRSFGRDGFF